METTSDAFILVCATEPYLIESVQVAAAALEVGVQVVPDVQPHSSQWRSAALRLVGLQQSRRVTPGDDPGFHILGDDPAQLVVQSARLNSPVVALPSGGAELAALIAQAKFSAARQGTTVGLVGATGGIGVSSLAGGLAMLAGQSGQRCAAVDLATAGGGLDLLLGAEAVEGVRWADLSTAGGQLGDLWPSLPTIEGTAVLTHSREDPEPPGPRIAQEVISALAKHGEWLFIDLGRDGSELRFDQLLLVVGADVRSIAAGHMLARLSQLHPTAVVLRTGPGRSLSVAAVERALGLEVIAVIGHEKAMPGLAELGMSPVAPPARRFVRQTARLLERLSHAG